jgi:hypothetical protein
VPHTCENTACGGHRARRAEVQRALGPPSIVSSGVRGTSRALRKARFEAAALLSKRLQLQRLSQLHSSVWSVVLFYCLSPPLQSLFSGLVVVVTIIVASFFVQFFAIGSVLL